MIIIMSEECRNFKLQILQDQNIELNKQIEILKKSNEHL